MERESKKRVVIDIYCLLIADTGIRKYLEGLIQLIQKNEREEFEYIFLPSLHKVEQTNNFRKKTFILFRVFSQLETFLWKQVYIPYKLWKLKADLAFFPDYYAPALKLSTYKLVMYHDTFFWDEPAHYGKWWLMYFKWITRLGLNGRSGVLTISYHVKNNLYRVLRDKVKVDVIHHPAQNEVVQFNDDVFKEFGLVGKKYFLHVGVFEKRKELPVLVEAFSKFLKKVKNPYEYKLVLVGRKAPNKRFDDYNEIVGLIGRLGLEESVVLPGYLSNEEVALLYLHAWSYVFPSRNEGFGIPVLEAFSAECPLIISNQPALMEVAGGAALVFDVGNAEDLSSKMLGLSDKRRLGLVELGKSRLSCFKREDYLPKLESIFSNALNGNDARN